MGGLRYRRDFGTAARYKWFSLRIRRLLWVELKGLDKSKPSWLFVQGWDPNLVVICLGGYLRAGKPLCTCLISSSKLYIWREFVEWRVILEVGEHHRYLS